MRGRFCGGELLSIGHWSEDNSNHSGPFHQSVEFAKLDTSTPRDAKLAGFDAENT